MNNDDLYLISAVIAGQHLSITRADHGTCGDSVLCGRWRVETQLGAVLVHSIQQRKQNRLFHIYILFSVARAGEVRPEVSKLYDGFLVFLLRHNGQHAGDPVIARVPPL